jgi:hypothetical protein
MGAGLGFLGWHKADRDTHTSAKRKNVFLIIYITGLSSCFEMDEIYS